MQKKIDGTTNLSLCMIVRNEAHCLGKCLASIAQLVDEIIIVDTGSQDKTKEIACQFTQRIYDYSWQDDFAAARNYSLEKAKGNWILVLDADESLELSKSTQLAELTSKANQVDGYLLPIKNLLHPEFHEWQTALVLRLFRNAPDLRFQGKIHEQVIIPKHKKVAIAEEGPLIIHLGYCTDQRRKKHARNLKMLKNSLTEDPTNPYHHFYLSTEYINSRDYPKALTHVRRALRDIPPEVLLFRSGALRNMVFCLTELSQLAEAQALLEAELINFPDFADYHYLLGKVCQLQKDYPKGIRAFECALACQGPIIGRSISGSNSYKAHYHLAQCEEKLHCYFDAITHYRMALQENPDFPLPLAGLIKCLLTVGSDSTCEAFIKQNFTIRDSGLHLWLAQFFVAAGYLQSAEAQLQHLLNTPHNDHYALLSGEIALLRNQPQQAQHYFEMIPQSSAHYSQSLLYRCLCAWKSEKPCKLALLESIGQHGSNCTVAQLLKYINTTYTQKFITPPLSSDPNPNYANREFATNLYIKLIEFQINAPLSKLSVWLINRQPASRWDLLYHSRKLGQFNQVNILEQGISKSPKSYIAKTEVYHKLSQEFLAKVPVLTQTHTEQHTNLGSDQK